MRNFNLFLLAVMLIWSSHSAGSITYEIVGPFLTSAFTCLYQSLPSDGEPYAIIRAYQNSHSPPGIDPNALQTLTNAYAAGFTADFYVEICRGINATSQINLVNTELFTPLNSNPKSSFYFMFFIKVVPSSNPECSWESYSYSDNCNFLRETINAVVSVAGAAPNIFSTAQIWAKFFGNSCNSLGAETGASVSYASYDASGHVTSTQSLSDYVPFGGWTVSSGQVVAKQIDGSLTVPLLCGSIAWHAFIDVLWFA